MKYTIEGFPQPVLLELGLDAVDAHVIRWWIDFSATGKMRCVDRSADGGRGTVRLFWVQYQAVIDDLPVLGITTPNNMARRFMRLVGRGVLVHTCVRDGGTFSYFGPGEHLERLIREVPSASSGVGGPPRKAEGSAPEGVGGPPVRTEGSAPEGVPNDPSSSDPSTRTRLSHQSARIAPDPGTRKWTGVSGDDLGAWTAAYPAVDVSRELAKAMEWVLANPNKTKRNWRRFLVGWLSRCQERGGTKGYAGAVSRPPSMPIRKCQECGLTLLPTSVECPRCAAAPRAELAGVGIAREGTR